MKKKLLITLLLCILSNSVFAKQYTYKWQYKPHLLDNRPDVLSVLEYKINDLIDKGYRIVCFSIKSNSRIDDGFIIVYEDNN